MAFEILDILHFRNLGSGKSYSGPTLGVLNLALGSESHFYGLSMSLSFEETSGFMRIILA